jgi:(2R)-ethylmalonyl-CoA mutase
VDPAVEAEMIADVELWRSRRDGAAVAAALDELRRVAETDANLMPATVALAQAGGTTGEWAGALREVFGEYRAPTGVGAASGGRTGDLAAVATRVAELAGGPPRLLVAKPGLDGHSNGAEQIAVAARDAGMEVVYSGIRLTPEQIAASARDEDPDVIGLSVLSGSHRELVPEVLARLASEGVDAPVVVGGIIPEEDRAGLLAAGVRAVYTPKDFELARIMDDIAGFTEEHRSALSGASSSGQPEAGGER